MGACNRTGGWGSGSAATRRTAPHLVSAGRQSRGGRCFRSRAGSQWADGRPDPSGGSPDCGLLRSVGTRATNADPVIKPNVELFNSATCAAGAWRQGVGFGTAWRSAPDSAAPGSMPAGHALSFIRHFIRRVPGVNGSGPVRGNSAAGTRHGPPHHSSRIDDARRALSGAIRELDGAAFGGGPPRSWVTPCGSWVVEIPGQGEDAAGVSRGGPRGDRHRGPRAGTSRPGTARSTRRAASPWCMRPGAAPRARSARSPRRWRDAATLVLATDPDREGEAIAWPGAGMAAREGRARGQGGPARRLPRDHPRGGGATRWRARAISTWTWCGPSRARRALDYLVGFHLSAPAVAQGARRPVGGARAVGGAPAAVRARGRDRGVRARGILDRGGRRHGRRRHPHGAARPARRGGARPRPAGRRGGGGAGGGAHRRGRPSGSPRSSAARCGATRCRRSPPRRCSRRPRARLGFGVRRTMRVAQRLYEGVDLDGRGGGADHLYAHRRHGDVEEPPATPPAGSSAPASAGTTCPPGHGPSAPAGVRRRRRTRRSGRPTSRARRSPSPGASATTRRRSTR